MSHFHDPYVSQHVAKKIKELRQANKLTQNQVSARLNIALSAYQRYERSSARVSADVLFHLAVEFGVKPGDFFPQEEP